MSELFEGCADEFRPFIGKWFMGSNGYLGARWCARGCELRSWPQLNEVEVPHIQLHDIENLDGIWHCP